MKLALCVIFNAVRVIVCFNESEIKIRAPDPRASYEPHVALDHLRPKPWALLMATLSLSCSFSRLLYSGSSSTLKHVWLVGSRSVSGPPRCDRSGGVRERVCVRMGRRATGVSK